MENPTPTKISRTFSKAEDNAVGCHTYEVDIHLNHYKEADILGALAPARTTETTYQDAKAVKLDATKARRLADKDGRTLIKAARSVLEPKLGAQWSQMWAAAGFVNGSLAMPRTIADRIALLMALSAYFTLHQAYETEQMGVTASALSDAHAALHNTNATCNACKTDLGTKRGLRNTALKTLKSRMRGLTNELKDLLAGDDPRWNAFGLNMPDAVGLPGVTTGLVVTGGAPGHLLGVWQNSALADRWRVYRKIVGVDSDFVLVKTTTEREADLNTFTSGQVVRVRVSAGNDAGYSLPGDTIEQTVP